MQQALDALHDRLAPAEEIFFTWLMRVFAAATLVGSAWIDDAPPSGARGRDHHDLGRRSGWPPSSAGWPPPLPSRADPCG